MSGEQNRIDTTPELFDGPYQRTVQNYGPDTLYYGTTASVSSSSNTGSIASGATATLTAAYWLVSAGRSIVLVTELSSSSAGGVETVNTVTTAGAAQTIPDPAAAGATVNVLTLTAATCVLTLPPDPPAGRATSLTIVLIQDATGARTVTWPAATKWPAKAGAPTLTVTAAGVDYFTLINRGAGWVAASMLNVG